MRTTTMSQVWLCLLPLLAAVALTWSTVEADTLRGVTIENWPYIAQRKNGQFEGFCVDLLNELFKVMGHTYTLQLVEDGKYGGWLRPNGSLAGTIGQVNRGEVDFAIGDITSTTVRARYVDFTQPFLNFGLAALVRRDIIDSIDYPIKSFKDLSEQTELKYGVKRTGANLPLFHDSPVVKRMYSFMDTHPSVFVSGEREGLDKVRLEKYAFIAESLFVEYVVQRDCSLVAIDDRRKHFQFEYAIVLPKGSPWKSQIDRALVKLKRRGVLRELKDKYWRTDQCQRGNTDTKNDGSDEDGTETINFSARSTVKDHEHARTNDALVKPSEPYRSQPHEVVDENDFEYIKPREEGKRKRPERPVKRIPGNGVSLSSLVDNLLVVLTLAWFCLMH